MTCHLALPPRRVVDPAVDADNAPAGFIVTRFDYVTDPDYAAAAARRQILQARFPARRFSVMKELNETGDAALFFVSNFKYAQARTLAAAIERLRACDDNPRRRRDIPRIRVVINVSGAPAAADIAAARAFRDRALREFVEETIR